jgi:ABC-type lipoprotein release transport system permease subunit
MGARIALGATPASVACLVVSQTIELAACGIALGSPVGAGVSKMLSSAMLAVSRFDGIPFAGRAALPICGCIVATVLPSMRAFRLDPMSAPRHDR